MAAGEERLCVVTGGRGFAARHLVQMLISSEKFSVRVADLGPSIDLEPDEENGVLGEALRHGRAEYVTVDLRDKEQVLKGFAFFSILWIIVDCELGIGFYFCDFFFSL